MDLSYEGTDFAGWAKQPGQRTVQGLLEDALAKQPPGRKVSRSVVVAGRTDAGVHAEGQVVHVDAVPFRSVAESRFPLDAQGVPVLKRIVHRWNRILPGDVRVLSASMAPEGFDARFSALRRHYRYQVSDAPWGVDPSRRRDTLAWNRSLDVNALNVASRELLGLRDFASFCKLREGATTVRELQRFEWERVAEHLVVARVSADAFCHSMVRSLVGALLLVGDGRRGRRWPMELAGTTERTSAVAPARGLTLVGVDYPDGAELRARAERTRAIRSLR